MSLLTDERTELFFVLASLTLAGSSIAWGFRIHRQQRLFLTLGAAAAMMGAGRFLAKGSYEIALVTLGAGLLTVSHILNYQLCRSCVQCEQEELMEHSQVVLRAVALSLGYGAHTVLHNVHFEVRPGEFWFFLGPNGGGKTTLLKAVLGLLTPQAGQLSLDPLLASRAHTGFVPQQCELNPTLPTTIREFVLLGLVGIKVSRVEQSERLTWALDKMGLSGMAKRNYWSLSGGQRQRALVARALVRRPTLLVLDEPTNNLDLLTEDALLRLLVALNKEEGLTLLFVTHNVGIAARYATHVGLLYSGSLLSGPRQRVLTIDNLAHMYDVNTTTAIDLFALNSALELHVGERT
jgi:ABC-type Mn2+/Zn2+ transport system ATPase subunit